jgi:hypothetical protein
MIALLWNVVHWWYVYMSLTVHADVEAYPSFYSSPTFSSRGRNVLGATNLCSTTESYNCNTSLHTRLPRMSLSYRAARKQNFASVSHRFPFLVDHAFHPAISSGQGNSIRVLSAVLSYQYSWLLDTAHAPELAVPRWRPV